MTVNYSYAPPQYYQYNKYFLLLLVFISSCQLDEVSDIINPDVISLQIQLENIELRLSEVQQLYKMLSVQNQEQSKVIEREDIVIETIESENKKQKEDLAKAQDQLNNLRVATKQNGIDIEFQKEEIKDLEEQGRDQEVIFSGLLANNKDLVSALEGLKADLLVTHEEIKRLEGANVDLSEKIQVYKDLYKTTNIKVIDLEEKLRDLPDLETTKVKVPEILGDEYSSNDGDQSDEGTTETNPTPEDTVGSTSKETASQDLQEQDKQPEEESTIRESDEDTTEINPTPENTDGSISKETASQDPQEQDKQPEEDSTIRESDEDTTEINPTPEDADSSTSKETIEPQTVLVLDDNGVTVKSLDCSQRVIGNTYTLNNISYLVVNRTILLSKIKRGEDVTKICTTCVTNMKGMFNGANDFNQDISSWDVGNVTNMEDMFRGASSFNQDVGLWNVSRVTKMKYMFYRASSFDQEIGLWDVSNVTDMHGMFFLASIFNGDITGWVVSEVTDMSSMFQRAGLFNQNIGGWDVGEVTAMKSMFPGGLRF